MSEAGPNTGNDKVTILPTPITAEAIAAVPLLDALEADYANGKIEAKEYMDKIHGIQISASGKNIAELKTPKEREEAWRIGDARIAEVKLSSQIQKTKRS